MVFQFIFDRTVNFPPFLNVMQFPVLKKNALCTMLVFIFRDGEYFFLKYEFSFKINESIDFTIGTSEKALPFLDIIIFKQNNRISTDLFCVENDSHQ
jgi:hypothetical protein